MHPPASIPGIRVHLLGGRFPTIATLPAPAAPWTDTYESAWQRLCAANPRLHDGPIWSATRADAELVTVQLDRYRRLAIQSDPTIGDLGVLHVGVKGLITAAGADGVQRILLARRGRHTRAYPNLWEIAPAGGVEADIPLSPESIIRTLVQEAKEELGIDASPSAQHASPFLLVKDETARSVVFMVHLPCPGRFAPAWQLPQTWEYTESRWLTCSEAAQWMTVSPSDITPPARAALAAFLEQRES